MASSRTPQIVAFKASAAIAKNVFVKFGADRDHVTTCGAGERAIGIAMNAATAAEDVVEIAMIGGGARLKLGNTVTIGQIIKSDASGFGIKASAEGDWCAAIAMESGVVNDIISVDPVALTAHAAEA